MSETIIYAVKQDEEPIFIGECRNAWRGAMYVWNDIAKRYFGLDSFPMLDDDMRSKIWNAGDEKSLTDSELIVLASTMDKAVVKKEGISQLLSAFKEYGDIHENSSISDQAKLISDEEINIPDGYSLAWVQTSVGEGWFKEYNEETEDYLCNTAGSFDVIDQTEEAACEV